MLKNLKLPFLALPILIAGCATQPMGQDSGISERDRIVRLQIYLDNANFGPGVIDGRWGYFTEKSRERLLRVRGQEFNENWERTLGVETVQPIYSTYTITAADAGRIGTIPSDVAEQAKLKSLPYQSLAELVAERYHTTENFLAEINPGMNMNALTAGAVLRVPNVRPFAIASIPHKGGIPANPAHAGRRIQVDTSSRYLDVISSDNKLLATFPITPGSAEHPAPAGDWRIAGVATLPWYRYDEGVLKRGERTEDFYMLPHGPNSPVGIVWMGLNRPGVGLHGTNNPNTIGRAGSHGCIRLANWDAAKLLNMVGKGTPVKIQ